MKKAREKEPEREFLWLGNHPCLDFVNTERMWEGERIDLITDASALLVWLKQAGLLTDMQAEMLLTHWQQSPGEGVEVLAQVRAFRAAVRHLAEEIVTRSGPSEESVQAINDQLRARIGFLQVAHGETNGFVQRFVGLHVGEKGDSGVFLLGLLAEMVTDLLCHTDLSLVRKCENPRCILFFLDTTKNHARQWCSMSGCGNRAKAAAHYRRTRENKE